MIITYHGVGFFKIVLGNTTVALNPVSKNSTHPTASGIKSFGADVVLISVDHSDCNGVEIASRGDKEPFVIAGPGEYEISDIFVQGFESKTKYKDKTFNTIYLIRMEGITLCYLGVLSSPEISSAVEEKLEEIDVLFTPIGGDGVLSPKDAHRIAVHLEPKIIIPMHYTDKELKVFSKEEGESVGKPVEKFTLKPKDLSGKEGNTVVLKVT